MKIQTNPENDLSRGKVARLTEEMKSQKEFNKRALPHGSYRAGFGGARFPSSITGDNPHLTFTHDGS
jgi:hypothetical protein